MLHTKRIFTGCMSMILLLGGAGGLLFAQSGPGVPPPGFGPEPHEARGPEMRPGPPPVFPLYKIAGELNLTDDQVDQIKGILDAKKDQLEQAKENVIQAEAKLDVNVPDTFDALGAAHAEAAYLRAQTVEEIKSVLTTEQVARMEELKPARKGPPEGARGPRHGKMGI